MRHDDWIERLLAYVNGVKRHGFRPGEHDCALFVAGAVEAMTGVDHAAEFRGRYRTLDDGLKLMAALGYDGHVGFVEAHFEEVPVLTARRGDIAVVATPEGDVVGIVQGPYVWGAGLGGLNSLPLERAKRAFRV